MRAKLINEDIKDILKPKSLSEIGKKLGIDLENIDPNELLKIGVMNRSVFFINTAVKRGANLLWTEDFKVFYKITSSEEDYVYTIRAWTAEIGITENKEVEWRWMDFSYFRPIDKEQLDYFIKRVERLKNYYES